MGAARVNRATLTIANGGTTSNVLNAWNSYGSSAGMIIYSPATRPETVNFEVSSDGITWHDLQDGDPLADVTVPAAGKALYYDRLVIAGQIRLVATSAVGGERVFKVSFQEVYN